VCYPFLRRVKEPVLAFDVKRSFLTIEAMPVLLIELVEGQ